MSYKAWNGTRDVINVANGGTVSDPFSAPLGAKVLSIYFPAMTSVAASGTIQALVPPEQDGASEVWLDEAVFEPSTGARTVINELIEAGGAARCVTIAAAILGEGVYRIGGLEAQAAARAITLFWGKET